MCVCSCGETRSAVVVAPVELSMPVGAVRDIGGFVGARIAASRVNGINQFDIEKHIRMVEEKKHKDWWWVGEQPGKWIEAAVLLSRQSGDQALEAKARAILARMEMAQEPSGYVGITDPALRTPKQPLRGMDAYELYFTLHGILTAAEEWNDPQALKTAKRLGDYFVDHIGPGKAAFWPSPYRPPENTNVIICPQYAWVPSGTLKTTSVYERSEIAGHTAHYGWEGTLLIDPMLRLYQATGEQRYLDWATWVVANLDTWNGWQAFANLDKVADGTMGMHQLQPYVHSHTFQMNFLGLLRLYEITGDASLLRKVKGAWRDVASRQMYITGGVSVREHYEAGYYRPAQGEVVETCASMSWMELTQKLLELTGDPAYADAIERLLLNHVFASQTVDGDAFGYHTPPNGYSPQEYSRHPDCCSSSGPRLLAMLPRFFYAANSNTVFVNQFVSSKTAVTLEGGLKVGLAVHTAYPVNDTVTISIELDKPASFGLNVRMPGWCASPALAVNGVAVSNAVPGTYAQLRRTWKNGDRVSLTLPMAPTWVALDHADTNNPAWALVRGPVVFALHTVWWDSAQTAMPFDVSSQAGVLRADALKEKPADSGSLGPFYEAGVQLVSGPNVHATFVPFANIGRWYRDKEHKPEQRTRAFSYAVWLSDAAAPSFQGQIERWRQILLLEKNSFDFVVVGNEGSEQEHRVTGGATGAFNNRMYRHAGNGEAFSWVMRVPRDAPADLMVTYWGGEPEKRVFDVRINNTNIATQTLCMDKPGAFIDVRYPIPEGLIEKREHGPRFATVTFQAPPGKTAGGVFAIRVLERSSGRQ